MGLRPSYAPNAARPFSCRPADPRGALCCHACCPQRDPARRVMIAKSLLVRCQPARAKHPYLLASKRRLSRSLDWHGLRTHRTLSTHIEEGVLDHRRGRTIASPIRVRGKCHPTTARKRLAAAKSMAERIPHTGSSQPPTLVLIVSACLLTPAILLLPLLS